MNSVNYDKARYSLAIIDLDLFIEGIQNMNLNLSEAKENMELILSRNDENLVPFLKRYSLSKFEDVKKYMKTVKSKIDKYRNNLIKYFSKNLIAQEIFNIKAKNLNNLIEEKQVIIDAYILQCENYIAKNSKCENIEK